jgi:hypothetical protein
MLLQFVIAVKGNLRVEGWEKPLLGVKLVGLGGFRMGYDGFQMAFCRVPIVCFQ